MQRSKSIQVKSLLSHSQYSSPGAKLPPVNGSFCGVRTIEKGGEIASACACNQWPGFDWRAALLAWHRLRNGSSQITIYTLSSNAAQVKSLSQQQVPWGSLTHTHREGMSGRRKEEDRIKSLKLWHFTYMADHKGFLSTGNLSYLQRERKKRQRWRMLSVFL